MSPPQPVTILAPRKTAYRALRPTIRQLQILVLYVAVILACVLPILRIHNPVPLLNLILLALGLPPILLVLTLLVLRVGPGKEWLVSLLGAISLL